MIQVPQGVYDGICAVRDSGETNMFSYQDAIEIALVMGYDEAAAWMEDNKSSYVKGIFEGFEVGNG
jgi:hypothetical protein